MSTDADTIVALSSPSGDALRAVIRLSGPAAASLSRGMAGAVLLRGPNTYTREDLVEIHLPGAPPLVNAMLRELIARGARAARPGEFTLRAFLNGRLDLTQAEAVERLISSGDGAEGRAALRQLRGDFSRCLHVVEEALLNLCADAEAAIDFVDQDIEILSVEDALARIGTLQVEVATLLAESAARHVADELPVVALLGRPNVGKSALFNVLTGSDAITSGVAGTTRDVLAADLDVGVRIRLLDTAGDRRGEGVETEATLRGREAARAADLLLFVVDATDWETSLQLEPRGRPAILIVNKCDLAPGGDVCSRFQLREKVCASARTGEGLDRIRDTVVRMLGEGAPSATFHLNVRQYALLREAEAALGRAVTTARELGMDFLVLDLRTALDALGGITGRRVDEDLLDRIFIRFCLGK